MNTKQRIWTAVGACAVLGTGAWFAADSIPVFKREYRSPAFTGCQQTTIQVAGYLSGRADMRLYLGDTASGKLVVIFHDGVGRSTELSVWNPTTNMYESGASGITDVVNARAHESLAAGLDNAAKHVRAGARESARTAQGEIDAKGVLGIIAERDSYLKRGVEKLENAALRGADAIDSLQKQPLAQCAVALNEMIKLYRK